MQTDMQRVSQAGREYVSQAVSGHLLGLREDHVLQHVRLVVI